MVTPPFFNNLKWNALNLGAALFAKAGPTPWVLEKAFADFDMIVGFGLSLLISRTKRAGNHPRFIGAANVFDANGRWMFFEGTQSEEVGENRIEQLKELFATALKKYKAEKAAFPRSVALHYYKRFGRKERDSLRAVAESYAPGCKIAYVTVDDSHAFRAYDTNNIEGDFARGGAVMLGAGQFLLCTSGHTPYAGKRIGTPRLLNVSFQVEPEGFTSAAAIAEHLLALTKLNYQTVTLLVREPATLLFANLVARFAAAMSSAEYRELVKTFSSQNFKAKLWFL
jgi:argonaute-like protein implicated in RNA metabolism and viral defense